MPLRYSKQTKERATELYFEIEKHFAMGGGALSLRDISKMLRQSSSGSAQKYVGILRDWKLIAHKPRVFGRLCWRIKAIRLCFTKRL